MKKRKKISLSLIFTILFVCVVITSVWLYSAAQLRILKDQAVYASPEDGMREIIEKNYSGVSKVEIVRSEIEVFDDLWFVEAHVWAANRADSKGFSDQHYDNPGNYFLRVKEGWVFVPEGKLPELIVLGKKLFRLSA
jgi:hypothetical protein